jgi:hypothetical protein
LSEWGRVISTDIPNSRGAFMRAWKDAHAALARQGGEGGVE